MNVASCRFPKDDRVMSELPYGPAAWVATLITCLMSDIIKDQQYLSPVSCEQRHLMVETSSLLIYRRGHFGGFKA